MADKTTVHVLDCGALECDLQQLLLDPGLMASRDDKNKAATWVKAPSLCVVVDTPDGRLLYDTSCPRDWEERWGPTGLQEVFPYADVSEDQYLDSRLKQLNLEPSDIDIVMVSHLHFDHAGNAGMFKDSGSRLVISKAEQDFAFGFEGLFKGAHLKTDYENLKFETVEGDTEILPGVTLLETPGHTIGTMSMQVDLADSGTMIFTSDAVYRKESYGPPPVGAAIVYDNQAWLRSVEKIRGVAERTNATIVFGHDEHQVGELNLAPGASYT